MSYFLFLRLIDGSLEEMNDTLDQNKIYSTKEALNTKCTEKLETPIEDNQNNKEKKNITKNKTLKDRITMKNKVHINFNKYLVDSQSFAKNVRDHEKQEDILENMGKYTL